LTIRRRPLPSRFAPNFRLTTLSLAREIMWPTFSGTLRAFFVPGPTMSFLAFSGSSPPDYMRVISGTSHGALALFFASHGSSFKVPSDCYTMATHRVLGLAVERTSHVLKCPRWNETPFESRGSLSTVSGASVPGERSTIFMLMGLIPRCPCSLWSNTIQVLDRVVNVRA
jgi:hypothetical protein